MTTLKREGGRPIGTSRFTTEQTVLALRQAEAGAPIEEVCRKLGISEGTFHRWRKRLARWGLPRCGSCGSCAKRTDD